MKSIHFLRPLCLSILIIWSGSRQGTAWETKGSEANIYKPQAVVFWNGVNGCKPSLNPRYDFMWQENIDRLCESIDRMADEFAEPFGIMAKYEREYERLIADLEKYIRECERRLLKPVIVMAPQLNIEGYIASLNPDKSNLFTIDAELVVNEDLEWTKSVTPIVLKKLSEAGYEVVGYAHSWGGTMAAEGMNQAEVGIRHLMIMNARVALDKLEFLESKALVGSFHRITTSGDAPTYFGKSAFGKGDIHIVEAHVPGGLSSVAEAHNIFFLDPSTDLTIEVDGTTLTTNLRRVLREDFRALPGDLIVRHGRNLLGPPLLFGRDIPHMGILLENDKAFDLRAEPIEGIKHGVIYQADWNDETRFRDAGFFSVLESSVPIKFKGKTMKFKDLPLEIKQEMREKVCEIAARYIGTDVGEYGRRTHCGDAVMDVYQEALTSIGITVLRYRGPFAFIKDLPGMESKGLVEGTLRDWFVNDWIPERGVMDPSEANDKLPRMAPPESPGSSSNVGKMESGASMKMEINSGSVRKDTTGVLEKLRNTILGDQAPEDSLSWHVKEKEERK